MAQPSTPAEWRDVLNRRLDARWATMRVFDAYYDGDQALAFITRKYRDAYGNFFKGLTDNWMPLVVDSSAERLHVQGFRFDNKGADDEAWSIWQANGCDAAADQIHTESCKLGVAYWMVTPQGSDVPLITAEHPSQVIVAVDPSNRRNRIAAFKKWMEDDGTIYANVYLPDRVVKYESTRRKLAQYASPGSNDGDRAWETIEAIGNPLNEVPVVPIPNNPGMMSDGCSDLEGGPVELQNAINLLLSGLLIGAEYQAYPLRVLLGVDTPKDPQTGLPIRNAELKMSQSRLLMFGGDAREMDVKEFSPAELQNLRTAMDGLIRDLTAQTRTPPHYVAGQIVNASGDALKAAETGLVAKVRKKMDPMGEGHEDTIRLAFRAQDRTDPRADSTAAETIWRDPETRSEGEVVDAATKLAGIGVPQEALWERIGASPQEIDRWRVMAEQEAIDAQARAALAPQPGGPGGPGPGGPGPITPEQLTQAVAQGLAGPGPAPPATANGGG